MELAGILSKAVVQCCRLQSWHRPLRLDLPSLLLILLLISPPLALLVLLCACDGHSAVRIQPYRIASLLAESIAVCSWLWPPGSFWRQLHPCFPLLFADLRHTAHPGPQPASFDARLRRGTPMTASSSTTVGKAQRCSVRQLERGSLGKSGKPPDSDAERREPSVLQKRGADDV